MSWDCAEFNMKVLFSPQALSRVLLKMFWKLIVFSTIAVVPITVSASMWDSDPSWPSGDLSDSELPLSPTVFSSNLALLPSDQTASLFGPAQLDGDSDAFLENMSDSLFSNTDNSLSTSSETGLNELNFVSTNDPPTFDFWDAAGCSMSMPLSATGKSRVRRSENSESCKNPTSGADIPPLGGEKEETDLNRIEFNEMMKDPETRRLLFNAESNGDHNPYCYLLTGGLLPWGVCDSGNRDDVTDSLDDIVFPGFGRFVLYKLTHCTAGTYSPLEQN